MKKLQQAIFNVEFRRFVVVGGVGFLVDGSVLTLLVAWGLNIFVARAISFLLAVSCTWLLNRRWTFARNLRPPTSSEGLAYLTTQIFGALINLTVFIMLLNFFPHLQEAPIIPLAFGSAIALGFNFFVSKFWVFKNKKILTLQ
jgi:putative flippase GtrA